MATRASTRGKPWGGVSRWVFIGAGVAIAISFVCVLGVRGYRGWRVEKELRAAQIYRQQRDNRERTAQLEKSGRAPTG